MGNINGKKVLQVVRTVEAGGVEIDDTTTSATKVWSSEKTSTEITNATKNKVVYTTTDTPTTSGSSYIFDKNNISPTISDTSIIGKELYQIVDSKIKYAYRVNMILNDDVYTSLVGEFGGGGGSQLYQHNVTLYTGTNDAFISLTIINSNSNAIDTIGKIASYFNDNGLTGGAGVLSSVSGGFSISSVNYMAYSACRESASSIRVSGYSATNSYSDKVITSATVRDKVITL